MPEATTGKAVLSLLWRIPLVAIGMTLWVFATLLVFQSEGAPNPIVVVVFLVAGTLSIAAGRVSSGSSYLAAMIVAALFADFCAVVAFFAYLSAGLAN